SQAVIEFQQRSAQRFCADACGDFGKIPPITHIFGNQIWGKMLSTAQVLVGGAKYGCMFTRMRIYNKCVENVRQV
ncbi:MAG TPA: hypothetical protein QGF83_17250, partial [Sulfitobacter pontiacus]|uniref:hypothetical protein n=1 Tax=Sulfitobacter pontiacus TaxID=60137 RepID=UPI002ABEE3F7|nr:hypothetical protein [Sulfitobacter pontiacus]